MKDLVILGAGRNLLDTLDVIDAINAATPTWRVAGILDDHRSDEQTYCGIPVLGPLTRATELSDCMFVSTIWNDRVCRQLHEVLRSTGLDPSLYATLVHPGASVSNRANLGRGVLVNFGASIGGEVKISDLVSIGPGCVIGHDTSIDSYSVVAAGAIVSGGVRVDQNCYIGSGSMIRQNVRISEAALVGLGAVVIEDVPQMTTVIGNPAKPYVRGQ